MRDWRWVFKASGRWGAEREIWGGKFWKVTRSAAQAMEREDPVPSPYQWQTPALLGVWHPGKIGGKSTVIFLCPWRPIPFPRANPASVHLAQQRGVPECRWSPKTGLPIGNSGFTVHSCKTVPWKHFQNKVQSHLRALFFTQKLSNCTLEIKIFNSCILTAKILLISWKQLLPSKGKLIIEAIQFHFYEGACP